MLWDVVVYDPNDNEVELASLYSINKLSNLADQLNHVFENHNLETRVSTQDLVILNSKQSDKRPAIRELRNFIKITKRHKKLITPVSVSATNILYNRKERKITLDIIIDGVIEKHTIYRKGSDMTVQILNDMIDETTISESDEEVEE